MYAVEFEAKIEDGRIHVPEQFAERFRQGVRVILLTADSMVDTKEQQSNLIEQLLANPLNIPKFHPLKRDEIYAR
ncbi:MAG: hypothetical protein KDE58_21895 [Caldilineaceae bacterium]|nr:hypothetical protein [Caldilineaceae bacterium]